MPLIIGCGSLVRTDDGVGQSMALALSERIAGAEAIRCTQLTPELAEPISRADAVIFIDASAEGEPGSIRLTALEPEHNGGAFTHHVTPSSLLGAAADLYGSAPPAYLIAVAGWSFDYGAALSPQMEAILPALVDRAQAWIESDFANGG
jgi:hydrogenase maturation protease